MFAIHPCNVVNVRNRDQETEQGFFTRILHSGPVLAYDAVLPEIGTPAYVNRYKKVAIWLEKLQQYAPLVLSKPDDPVVLREFEYMAIRRLKDYLKSIDMTKGRLTDIFQHVILCIPGMKSISFDQIQGDHLNQKPQENFTQARLYNHIALHMLVCEPESESSLLGMPNHCARSAYRIVDRELPGIVLKCRKDRLIAEELVKLLSMINRGCIKYVFNPPLNADQYTSEIYFTSKYHYCSHGILDNIKLVIGEDCQAEKLQFTVQKLTFDYQQRFVAEDERSKLDRVDTMIWQQDIFIETKSILKEDWPSDLSGRMFHSAVTSLLRVDGEKGTQSYFNTRGYYLGQATSDVWYGLCGLKPGTNRSVCVQVPLPQEHAFAGYDLLALKKIFAMKFLCKAHPCLLEPNPETMRCLKAWNIPWQDQRVKNYFNSSTILSKQFVGSILAAYFPALHGVQFTDKPGQNMLRILHSRTQHIAQQSKETIETSHYVFSFGYHDESPIVKSPVYANILDIFVIQFTEMTVYKHYPNSSLSYLGRLLGDTPDRLEFGQMLQALKGHGEEFKKLLKDIALVMIEMRHVHFMEELDSFRTREVRGRMMKYLFPDEDRMTEQLRNERTVLYGKLDTKSPEELMGLELAMILIRCLYQVRFGGTSENRDGDGDFRGTRDDLRNSFSLVKQWLKKAAAISRDGFNQTETLVPFGLCPNLQEYSKPHLVINGAAAEVQHQNESYEDYLVKVQTSVRKKKEDDQKMYLSALLSKLQAPFLHFKTQVVVKFCDNLFKGSNSDGSYNYALSQADGETRAELESN